MAALLPQPQRHPQQDPEGRSAGEDLCSCSLCLSVAQRPLPLHAYQILFFVPIPVVHLHGDAGPASTRPASARPDLVFCGRVFEIRSMRFSYSIPRFALMCYRDLYTDIDIHVAVQEQTLLLATLPSSLRGYHPMGFIVQEYDYPKTPNSQSRVYGCLYAY